MTNVPAARKVLQALARCSEEPVHVIGHIQPIGALIGIDAQSERITHASDGSDIYIGAAPDDLLGREARAHFGDAAWHAFNNVRMSEDIGTSRQRVGCFDLGRGPMEIHASKSGDQFALEVEPGRSDHSSDLVLRDFGHLISQLNEAETEEALFDVTVRLMRTVTGYDRVMIYRFDSHWNGEVVAEARKGSVEPYLGLRFPHWDIPAQARDIMRRVPIRVIADVDHVPARLRADRADRAPLDITLALMRGVSALHVEYLRNMETAATMTLSLVVSGQLWGMVSLHHKTPRVPTAHVRRLLGMFLPVLRLRLELLTERARLAQTRRIDHLKHEVQKRLEEGSNFASVGPVICSTLGVDGVAVVVGSQNESYGEVPGQAVFDAVTKHAVASGGLAAINSLRETFPALEQDLGSTAGALVLAQPDNRALVVFRGNAASPVAWAGNPEKTIEHVSGQARLRPRGSFSTYLQEVDGRCESWRDADRDALQRLWLLLSLAERRFYVEKMSRQQALMIDELNHRVRNILALVKAVSRKARSQYASLEDYADSVEARIHALAAAHDLGSGASSDAVSLHRLLQIETEPYLVSNGKRVVIRGVDALIRAEAAPIFALIIHELVTNAAKYGALSVDVGRVTLDIGAAEGGLLFNWTEEGGPPVAPPTETGFGSALIDRAVPHELGGTSRLEYRPAGVQAEIFVPDAVLLPLDSGRITTSEAIETTVSMPLPEGTLDGMILLLEDNFVIAAGMVEELEAIGAQDVETAATLSDAAEIMATETPALAILDVNLGRGGTSEALALELHAAQVPFFFVSGYGESVRMPPELDSVPRLKKPVAGRDLERAIAAVVSLEAVS
ncbi:MAG: HWE histidine kinase domain-containing protein [Pseudomonadota bacterium]